jgi:L-amino acid N-acyltransferase YncA
MEKIRAARAQDAERMLEIYKPYVMETPVSLETEVPSLEEFCARLAEREGKFPWIVLEKNNEILGYAYASPFKSRRAYDWSVEATVYVKRGHHRSGIGKALYAALLEIIKKQGVINVFGVITLPNEGSIGLHEHFGFVSIGKFKDAGFKMGQWWDVGCWQLQFEKPKVPNILRPPQT